MTHRAAIFAHLILHLIDVVQFRVIFRRRFSQVLHLRSETDLTQILFLVGLLVELVHVPGHARAGLIHREVHHIFVPSLRHPDDHLRFELHDYGAQGNMAVRRMIRRGLLAV